MKDITFETVTEKERKNIEQCMKVLPDPVGARNCNPNVTVIEKIKKLSRKERLINLR